MTLEEEVNTKNFPTFTEYINQIIGYLLHRDDKFYIKFKWISPLRVQIEKIYYVKVDEKAKYLKEFKARRFFYLASELGIDSAKQPRNILFSCERIDEKYELKPLMRLPLEVF